MASSGRPAPPKPWERQANNSGPSPFAPSSTATSTTAAVANQGDNKPVPASSNVRSVPVSDGNEGRQMPLRPWERTTGYANPTYGAYNRPYNSYGGGYGGYNSGTLGGYNSGATYGGYGGGYGGYSGYTSPYGGMNYAGGYGSTYNNRYAPPYMPPLAYGAPPGAPGDPMGEGPPRPPNFWQSMVSLLHGALNFFGRIAMLVDENTQAFHFFITALLQLCDRAGVLYGELARFVLRLLGYRPRRPKGRQPLAVQHKTVEPEGGWDNVWGAPAAE